VFGFHLLDFFGEGMRGGAARSGVMAIFSEGVAVADTGEEVEDVRVGYSWLKNGSGVGGAAF
jgi:hypothetical protein